MIQILTYFPLEYSRTQTMNEQLVKRKFEITLLDTQVRNIFHVSRVVDDILVS